MVARFMLLVTVSCLPFLGACGHGAGDQAARLSAEGYRDMAGNRFEDAFQKLERAVDLRPDVADYHIGLGMAAARLGKMDVAEKQYVSAEGILAREAEHDPERVDDQVFILALLGRPAEARHALSNGLVRFPDSRTIQQLDGSRDSLLAVRELPEWRQYAITNVEPADAPEERPAVPVGRP
jgi:tetratricopeptide (TPR) repeat protein